MYQLRVTVVNHLEVRLKLLQKLIQQKICFVRIKQYCGTNIIHYIKGNTYTKIPWLLDFKNSLRVLYQLNSFQIRNSSLSKTYPRSTI